MSKGILGFGSQSVETFSSSDTPENQCNTQSAGLIPAKLEKVAHIVHSPPCGSRDSDPSSPTSQRSTSWSPSVVITHILSFLYDYLCFTETLLSFEIFEAQCST